jgi:threonylcarbamoyladenosine tRNA methylthiotransferase MtaB
MAQGPLPGAGGVDETPIPAEPPAVLAGTRVRVETMGCRVNRSDAAQLRAEISAMGCTVVDDAPYDIYLLNTCTVTQSADADARRMARKARRLCPQAKVVLTGCYAQVDPETLNAMDEVDLVVGNDGKADLASRIATLATSAGSVGAGVDGQISRISDVSAGVLDAALLSAGTTRFFLKVQEGCDVRCAFCIIPKARGSARSMAPDGVIGQLNRAYDAGYREAVLAGIHLGGYGEDLGSDFSALLARVLDETDMPRIRFGSLEPWGLSENFVALFSENPRLLPSLHLPLQSGSASVLRRMRRPCTPDFYRRQVTRILAAKPDLYLSADVLTGFPGETDAEFEDGFQFIESLPFAHLHVFPYSPRAGTPAAAMAQRVRDDVKKQRVHRLIALSDAKRQVALGAQVGRRTEVLVEVGGRGHSHNNFTVNIPPSSPPGSLVSVTITGVDGDALVGEPI